MFLTTNMISNVDPAVLSRVHTSVVLNDLNRDEREKLWRCMFSEKLKSSITGGHAACEAMFRKLASFKLNGREIKNVVQNAVTTAISHLDRKSVPQIKWIQPSLFVNEAEKTVETREQLTGGDRVN